MDKDENFECYIKFFGPLADDGKVDIEKAGRSLVALNKVFKKYQRDIKKIKKEDQFVLRIGGVHKKCSELSFFLEKLSELSSQVLANKAVGFAILVHGLSKMGIGEFGKQFFGTIGQQLALKIFSKGKRLKELKRSVSDSNQIVVAVKNHDGEEKKISAEEWDNYKVFNPYLNEIIQLEKGKEEKMSIGYKEKKKYKDLIEIDYKQKPFFDIDDFTIMEERMREPFDEAKAEEARIVGRFVDFYGLAHKYHFSFQARRNQDKIGKQKILCIVEKENISEIIDYLKPENTHNVCIGGKATRDWEGRVDKIKVEWVNKNENHNPNQRRLV